VTLDISNMVASVASTFGFSRHDMKNMFVCGDENDMDDLYYWYERAVDLSEKAKKPTDED